MCNYNHYKDAGGSSRRPSRPSAVQKQVIFSETHQKAPTRGPRGCEGLIWNPESRLKSLFFLLWKPILKTINASFKDWLDRRQTPHVLRRVDPTTVGRSVWQLTRRRFKEKCCSSASKAFFFFRRVCRKLGFSWGREAVFPTNKVHMKASPDWLETSLFDQNRTFFNNRVTLLFVEDQT